MSLIESALAKMQRSQELPAEKAVTKGAARDDAVVVGGHRIVPAASVNRKAPPGRIIELNRPAIRAAGLLPPDYQERQIADQYRQIKRPLIAAVRRSDADSGEDANLIMITSALAGDGKTFTSINLALSLANERDFDVVLVDADVAKPHISRLLGIDNEPGLLDALRTENVDVGSLILATDVPNLSVLPAGRRSDAATELLGSDRMREAARQLRGERTARLVVIDSPPLLLTNESRALADSVGQVVVVVRSGKTMQRDLRQALSHLDSSRHKISLVLNQAINPSTGDYYGYGDEPRSAANTTLE